MVVCAVEAGSPHDGFSWVGPSNVFYAFCPIVGSATDIAEWSGPRPDRDGSAHPKYGRKR